jgi:WhiB family redox-sensing transcriptional regulator
LWFPDIIDESGEEWFDDGTIWEAFGDTSPYYAQGKEICMSCPVRAQCLFSALENKERWGMWGGTTPIERRRVERASRRKRLKERRSREATENE